MALCGPRSDLRAGRADRVAEPLGEGPRGVGECEAPPPRPLQNFDVAQVLLGGLQVTMRVSGDVIISHQRGREHLTTVLTGSLTCRSMIQSRPTTGRVDAWMTRAPATGGSKAQSALSCSTKNSAGATASTVERSRT
jgi:hypothetical protein